jgi:hypothetical protein
MRDPDSKENEAWWDRYRESSHSRKVQMLREKFGEEWDDSGELQEGTTLLIPYKKGPVKPK